jgi:hypothetical protein
VTQRIILSLPGDTNMIELADALAGIGLGISAIAGIDGEVVIGKLNQRAPTNTTQHLTDTTHEQQ